MRDCHLLPRKRQLTRRAYEVEVRTNVSRAEPGEEGTMPPTAAGKPPQHESNPPTPAPGAAKPQAAAVSPRPPKRKEREEKKAALHGAGDPRPPSTGRRGAHPRLAIPTTRSRRRCPVQLPWRAGSPRTPGARLACSAAGDASGADAVCGYACKGGQRRTGGCYGWGLVSW